MNTTSSKRLRNAYAEKEKEYIANLQKFIGKRLEASYDEWNIILNLSAVKTKRQFYMMGVLSLVQMVGGAMNMFEQIMEVQNQGKITKRQAFDLRKAVKDALEFKDSWQLKIKQ